VVSYLTAETRRRALSQRITPYLAAVELAQMSLV
jgi:hypothetical protein